MVLKDLLKTGKAGDNAIQRLVENYWHAKSDKSLLSNFPIGSPEQVLSTKLDDMEGLIRQLEKVAITNSALKNSLTPQDFVRVHSLLETPVDEQAFSMLQTVLKGGWIEEEDIRGAAAGFTDELLVTWDERTILKEEVKGMINASLSTLKKETNNDVVYEHIITSILEIYSKKLPYIEVIEQICRDIENIDEPENSDIWCSMYSLANFISCSSPILRDFYREENDWESKISGEIYGFIQDNS